MKYGICHLSIVPCRLEPSDTSEMVSQLLFGDAMKVLEEKKGDWRRIKTAHDNYDCWVDKKQFTFIEKEEFDSLSSENVSNELAHVIEHKKSGQFIPILLGSTLPNFNNGSIKFGDLEFKFEGQTVNTTNKNSKDRIIENAMMYLGSPYLWGGRSPFGIDCSGFTQIVYKLNGHKLPRDASEQSHVGQTLSFIEESEKGDLAFFDNEEGDIIHVGIILENSGIIHASGKVRIDKIDHQGIFNVDTGKYTHRLRLIKKII